MVKTYSFVVDFIDVEKLFTLHYNIAASSLNLAYSRLCKRVVENFATKVVSARVRLVYEVEVNGFCSRRSLPSKYSSVILDCEDDVINVCS